MSVHIPFSPHVNSPFPLRRKRETIFEVQVEVSVVVIVWLIEQNCCAGHWLPASCPVSPFQVLMVPFSLYGEEQTGHIKAVIFWSDLSAR